MTAPGLAAVLEDCYRDKLADVTRHEASARRTATYDFNNAYQYTINREETQLSWLAKAIADLGGSVPSVSDSSQANAPDWRSAVEADARQAQAFVDKWTAGADAVGNARHRKLLRVIVGETLEQKRLFEQMLSGRTDLLGPRGDEVGPVVGEVLPTRWIE